MSILKVIAVIATEIAEGTVLAAAVYLVNRGVKHPPHNRKNSLEHTAKDVCIPGGISVLW